MLTGSGNDTLVGENSGTDDMEVQNASSLTSPFGAGNDLFLGGEGDNYISAVGSAALSEIVLPRVYHKRTGLGKETALRAR